MKRCLIPGILALGIHGLLFAMEFNWPAGHSLLYPKTPVVTMTLTYLKPQRVEPQPAAQMPAAAPKIVTTKLKTVKPKQKPIPDIKPDFVAPPKSTLALKPLKMAGPKIQPQKIETKIEHKLDQNRLVASEKPVAMAFVKSADQPAQNPPAPVIRKARPLYRRNPPPRYPRLARKRKYQGVVILEVFVNRQGSVGEAKVFKSSGYAILDKTALKSVKKWEFEPGKRGRDNVEMWVRVPVRFQLR
ncbi:MAG: energy transducer TonB [Deltaproteobacteria bacterium]|nr:MAG: energy transducer TonB [Deltaproteobacteria bacterium]